MLFEPLFLYFFPTMEELLAEKNCYWNKSLMFVFLLIDLKDLLKRKGSNVA